jgi:hypothetical protein
VFYWRNKPDFRLPENTEYREYDDIIMYKYFYPLLESIKPDSLVVVNECLRTRKRTDLTYNCLHHYLNLTSHRLVFQYFPFIEDKNDFIILLDMEDKSRFRTKIFDYIYLQTEKVVAVPVKIRYSTITVALPENIVKDYEAKKENLLDNLGAKDPDIVPRELQLFAGNHKKDVLNSSKRYVARNKRIKAKNVLAYNDIAEPGDYIILDFHYRRLNFNDFLKKTGMKRVQYICTDLPVDDYFSNSFVEWKARLDAFYAQTSLYK